MRHTGLILISGFIFCLYGCSSFSYLKDRVGFGSESKAESTSIAEEMALIEEGQRALAAGEYSLADRKFQELLDEYIGSSYYSSAKLGKAQALQAQQQHAEAAELFRQVAHTRRANPRLAAQALYQLSYSYESLGQPDKAVASLLDSQSLSKHMTAEMAAAEVPARLASLYLRIGNREMAHRYLVLADKAFSRIKVADVPQEKEGWRAEVFFKMGQFPIEALHLRNYDSFLESLAVSQSYLVAAIEQKDSIWSAKALEHLQEIYKELWHEIQSVPLRRTGDVQADLLQQKEKQAELLIGLMTALDQLKRLQIFPVDENDFALALADHTNQLDRQADILFQGLPEKNLLTPEAQKLMSLRRDLDLRSVGGESAKGTEGVIVPRAGEKPSPAESSKDPNL